MDLLGRWSAVVLSLGLLAGSPAVCAAWAPTPDARMACCSEAQACPMHPGDSHGLEAHHGLTQDEADACCASSEPQPSSPSPAVSSGAIAFLDLGTGVVVPA